MPQAIRKRSSATLMKAKPGCFKDRVILDYAPHAVIEGMTLAAYATGATRGFIYLRYEYPESLKILERALFGGRRSGTAW